MSHESSYANILITSGQTKEKKTKINEIRNERGAGMAKAVTVM